MIVIANKSGQMCNQIIEFMHPYACALEYGHSMIHLYSKDYQKYFKCELEENIKYSHYPLKMFCFGKRIVRGIMWKSFHISSKMTRQNTQKIKNLIEGGRIVLLRDSFYRDFESLNKHRHSIEKYFSFRDEIKKYGDSVFATIRKNNKIVVGVHLRRRDYRVYADGRLFFSDELIINWIKSLLLERNAIFLVFSDEEIDEEKYSDLPVIFMHGNAGEDLYAMSQCDYLFGPLSTFSWTAHFLGHNKLCAMTSSEEQISFSDFEEDVIGIV